MKIIDEVMTTAEAAERWEISAITVKQACSGQKGLPPRFKEGEEFRKPGRTWLVTKSDCMGQKSIAETVISR